MAARPAAAVQYRDRQGAARSGIWRLVIEARMTEANLTEGRIMATEEPTMTTQRTNAAKPIAVEASYPSPKRQRGVIQRRHRLSGITGACMAVAGGRIVLRGTQPVACARGSDCVR